MNNDTEKMTAEPQSIDDYFYTVIHAVVDPDNNYLPNAKKTALDLRKMVQAIESIRKDGFIRLLADTEATLILIDPKDSNALRNALQKAALNERPEIEAALKENRKDGLEQCKKYRDKFALLLKELRQSMFSIQNSKELARQIQASWEERRKALSNLVRWSNESLTLAMNNIGNEIKGVDQSLSKLTDKSFFDDALALLPTAETIGKIDLKCPEAGAVSAGYEALLSSIRLLGEQASFMKLLAERDDLKKQFAFLKENYNKAIEDQRAISLDLDDLGQMNMLQSHALQYHLLISPFEKDLSRHLASLEEVLSSTDDTAVVRFYQELRAIKSFLKNLNLLWQ